MPFPYAFAVALLVALAGWAGRALTRTATAVATLLGTVILWRTGWPGLAALGAFFIGSSLISRIAPDPGVAALDAKGATRDSWQVLANGGAALVGSLIPGPAALWVVTASLAAAAGDTWATSWGGWSRTEPRHILTWRRVPAGTSGGITLLGTVGALLGAATVGAAAALTSAQSALLPMGLGLGVLGMLLDSVVGSLWQGRFRCSVCDRLTEQRVHRCGNAADRLGGVAWLTNDGVNAVATGFAGLCGYGVWLWAVGYGL